MTVQGMAAPSSANTRVMPSLIPIIPFTAMRIVLYAAPVRREIPRSLAPAHAKAACVGGPGSRCSLGMTILAGSSLHRVFAAEGLDLHVNARRQTHLHQLVHRVRRGFENIDEPLMRTHLELLARLFVHVRRAQNRPAVDRRAQGNRPRHVRAGSLG